MAIAKLTDLQDAHDEYRKLYWEVNELRIIATVACNREARRKERRMAILIAYLGYTPEA
jgi:hypothetical protein